MERKNYFEMIIKKVVKKFDNKSKKRLIMTIGVKLKLKFKIIK